MKQVLIIILALSPILFATSCLMEPRDDERSHNDRTDEDYYDDDEYYDRYDDEDEFYIIGEDERPSNDPDDLSEILNQCSEDLYLIDERWAQLLLAKIFEADFDADYMAKEKIEADYGEFLYKNEDLVAISFNFMYNYYFPEFSAAIGVYNLDNGKLISSALFDRFVDQQNPEKNGYTIDYYVDFYASDAKNKFGDTLVFIAVSFAEEQSEFDEAKTGRVSNTVIDITVERYFALMPNGEFHETDYVYRELD